MPGSDEVTDVCVEARLGVLQWNYGFPQEMEHFVDCVLNDKQPLVTGDDGRAVMQIIFAAYESAGTGRRIEWPYAPPRDTTPTESWLSS